MLRRTRGAGRRLRDRLWQRRRAGNEFRTDDPLNTWRAYVVRVTEAGTVQWQASYGSPHGNNAAELVLPTRDGGFAVFADSDEHGFGEGANFALYKLAGDPPR